MIRRNIPGVKNIRRNTNWPVSLVCFFRTSGHTCTLRMHPIAMLAARRVAALNFRRSSVLGLWPKRADRIAETQKMYLLGVGSCADTTQTAGLAGIESN